MYLNAYNKLWNKICLGKIIKTKSYVEQTEVWMQLTDFNCFKILEWYDEYKNKGIQTIE